MDYLQRNKNKMFLAISFRLHAAAIATGHSCNGLISMEKLHITFSKDNARNCISLSSLFFWKKKRSE